MTTLTVKRGTQENDTSSCLLAPDVGHEASRENLQYNCMLQCSKDFFFNIILCNIFLLNLPCVIHIHLHAHTKFSV